MFQIASLVFIYLLTIAMMELVTWAVHKYVMHGFLWVLHKDHHENNHKRFEKNDLFAFIFGLPTASLIIFGLHTHNDILAAIGLGIATYGFMYFVLHDLIFHKRIPFLHIRPRHPYLIRLTRAHVAHHVVKGKENEVSMGFLYAPKKYAP
jgi:beta-carotene 3-hydroxylase